MQIARSSAARSAFARHGLLDQPRRRLERLADLRLGHALVEQRGGPVDLAQAADDRIDEPARALPVRLELLGQRERRLEVARDERVGEVVGLGAASRAASESTSAVVTFVPGGRARASFSSSRDEALLARPHQATSSLAASGSSWMPSSRPRSTSHGQLPRLRGGVLAHLAAGASIALQSCLSALPRAIATSTVSGGISARIETSGSSCGAFQAPTSSTST